MARPRPFADPRRRGTDRLRDRAGRVLTAAARAAVLARLADAIVGRLADGGLRVGIDGVDGAGKTQLADELAGLLRQRGVDTVRVSVDGFHQPAAVRHRRGRDSPEGFFLDSYDYPAFRRLVLDPLAPGGGRRIRRAIHDVQRDAAVSTPLETVPDRAVLLVDGIFLHRDELLDAWDLSVWLAVPFEVSIPRGAARGYGDPDPSAPGNRRYVEGQRLYLCTCQPQRRATIVVDNTDLDAPRVLGHADESPSSTST